MDRYTAELAFGWHMQGANAAVDPDAATRERVHALELAERFELAPPLIAQACAVLCRAEVERFGAPITERYIRRGLAAASSWGAHVGVFLEFDGLFEMERGALDVAEDRFTEALALVDAHDRKHVLAGLGTALLRQGRFDEARARFAEGLDRSRSLRAHEIRARELRLRLLEGLAEAERHAGAERAAMETSQRVLEATKDHKRDPALRAYRARAHNALGLLHWRRRSRAEAVGELTASLEVWTESERLHAGEAFVAWERRTALELGGDPPTEGSPGDFCAVAWVRLGRDLLIPAALTESPPSPIARARAAASTPGDTIEVALRSLIGRQVGERWHVSRAQTLRSERRVLIELIAAGPVE